jgi:type IV secretion system protein VirB4
VLDELRERLSFRDKPADEYLSVERHVADDVVVFADGTHGVMFSADGKAMSLFAEDGRYAERRRQHAAIRAMVGPGIIIYGHLVCHDRVEAFPIGRFRSAYAEALARDYHAASAPGLLARDWFITILARPSRVNGLLRRALGRTAERDESLVEMLEERCATLERALADYGLRRLGIRRERGIAFSEIGEAMRLMLYARWAPVPVPAGSLAGAIYTDRILCDRGSVEIQASGGVVFSRPIGMRDYPESLPPWALDALLTFRRRFTATNSLRPLDRASVTDKFGRRETQMENAGDRATSLIEGLGDMLDDVASGRTVSGDHHWCVTVHADSFEELGTATAEMRSLLVNAGLAAVPESWGTEAAFWGQLPGAPAWLRCRHGVISGFNFASFSSLVGFPRGGGAGHWGPAALRLSTAGATAHDYQPHVDGVGHTLLFGPTGCGKTVVLGLLAALLEPLLSPEGGVVMVLDADGSNELTVRACGGAYTRILRGQPSGMAPFKALPDTAEARDWLLEFTLGLITSDGGPVPAPGQIERLARGIAFLLRRRPEIRSFAALRQFADHAEGGCGERLARWCRGGALGWAFDGEEDRIRLDASIVGIDNSELLAEDAATVRAPMAAYQLFRIGERIGTGIPGAVLADEAQAYLPDARFAAGFERFVTRLRKGNGMLWLAMQQPQAILRHPIGQALVSNSPTKLLFPNAAAEAEAYREGLHCTEGELEAVREGMLAAGKGTFLVKRDAGSFVARADLSALPDHLAVLSANPRRRALAHRIMAQVGDDPSAWVPEYRRRHREADHR